ncbi:MAG TPA: hypothetical protein VGR49_08460 [Actinomycetota bacterium]|nr:hypothetical protein [Actinomycetota bacterium]
MREGQRRVERRGGQLGEIRRVALTKAVGMGRQECDVCFPSRYTH